MTAVNNSSSLFYRKKYRKLWQQTNCRNIMPHVRHWLVEHYSVSDNGVNRANCDTSIKVGTIVLCGLLVKSSRLANWRSKMAAIFSTRLPFLPYRLFFEMKMYLFGRFHWSWCHYILLADHLASLGFPPSLTASLWYFLKRFNVFIGLDTPRLASTFAVLIATCRGLFISLGTPRLGSTLSVCLVTWARHVHSLLRNAVSDALIVLWRHRTSSIWDI